VNWRELFGLRQELGERGEKDSQKKNYFVMLLTDWTGDKNAS